MKLAKTFFYILTAIATAAVISGCDAFLEGLAEELASTVEVSGRIDSDLVWSSENQFIVTDDIELHAVLEIEPGTRVSFEQGTQLEIRESGTLIAEGTAEEPILLTGTENTVGWWDGIWFRSSEDPRNSIDHAQIEFAGGDFFAVQIGEYRVTGTSVDASASITNTTIQNTGGHGLYVQRGSEIADFDSNKIIGSESYPVTLRGNPPAAASIGAGSDLTGNNTDAVRIFGDNDSISNDMTLVDPGVPYRVENADINVRNAVLTIADGVTMEFDSGSSIQVTHGGGLRIEGTEENQVLLTAVEQIPGYWAGLHYIDSDRPDNSIEHAVIEYGGNTPDFSGWNSSSGANITLGRSISSADLSISNSEIRHSSNYGIYVYDGSLDHTYIEFDANASGEVYYR
ncbi:hypothetical protein [Spirochaeta dissipatitropha]